ncbi:triphosphoribosyl-dephospho-CoA synthase [Ligilactobacillus salitolerans]|uniref:Probable 2-(5''-triphosphoribosyl)-3'-dephosphocoenzyme-A synthase n=1 Tax=Ligilactobacillus salitolerans TaxID=1808352 RepID=A0A401IUM1_9LACO|nr:triphosphoribosyl-dephospho-CoA synthase CitG [Ligilactobacillus salitolerans]GBG95250.1 triphosphoribosyl-dephospho-CoA synthase [Ligilactobacillus salitolerans]
MKFEEQKNTVIGFATKALLYEVTVNPKPGLVDPVDNGPHPDMDVFDFLNSAVSLSTYFEECFDAGWLFDQEDLKILFSSLRPLGIRAEKKMYLATNGVNTHKGAIFSLGIFVAATAYVDKENVESQQTLPIIQKTIIQMLNGLTKNDFKRISQKNKVALSAGELQFLQYGKAGIRGEAEAGYPTVFDESLPFLLSTQGTRNERLLDTLMKIVSVAEDSNLIKRAGTDEIVAEVQSQARSFLEVGGYGTRKGQEILLQLNSDFTERKLSLGGSADLLILTIYLGLLEGCI